jgi:L-methionine (R)-S-oxide reductase
MFKVSEQSKSLANKPEFYRALQTDLSSILAGERDFIANLANTSAMLFHSLPHLNWAGFYLLKGNELVLGPFQGKPACIRIAIGRGVCGSAAQRRQTIVVMDVHAFPGHIACDDASRSEIVVPLIKGDRLIGVTDLDSPVLGRFDDQDARGLETIAQLLLESSDM